MTAGHPSSGAQSGAVAIAASPSPWTALARRGFWLGVAATGIVVLGLAAWLHPDPAGHGTHTQLGLPPCGFLVWTGYPCAGCGMTTAFAHAIRLELFASVRANPFGLMLFLVTLVVVPWAVVGGIRGAPIFAALDRVRADRWALGLALASLTTWAARLVAVACS